jgi:hypothetical protein
MLRVGSIYPVNDLVIDSLVVKITLAHFRMDRGFVAEAETLRQGSLAKMLVESGKPFKDLGSYEASNRKMLKLLEEELARYLSMTAETGDPESMSESSVTSPAADECVAARPPAEDAPTAPKAAERSAKDVSQKQSQLRAPVTNHRCREPLPRPRWG